jgi:hypothetical protein
MATMVQEGADALIVYEGRISDQRTQWLVDLIEKTSFPQFSWLVSPSSLAAS